MCVWGGGDRGQGQVLTETQQREGTPLPPAGNFWTEKVKAPGHIKGGSRRLAASHRLARSRSQRSSYPTRTPVCRSSLRCTLIWASASHRLVHTPTLSQSSHTRYQILWLATWPRCWPSACWFSGPPWVRLRGGTGRGSVSRGQRPGLKPPEVVKETPKVQACLFHSGTIRPSVFLCMWMCLRPGWLCTGHTLGCLFFCRLDFLLPFFKGGERTVYLFKIGRMGGTRAGSQKYVVL